MRKTYILLGLGNIGNFYKETRHNIGSTFLDFLAKKHTISFKENRLYSMANALSENRKLILIKPKLYMNSSGEIIPKLRSWYSGNLADDLIVVTDNIDLPVGRCRLKKGKSYSTHNGLRSVSKFLSSQDYMRLHIGVGSPKEGFLLDSLVLSPFSSSEKRILSYLFSFLVDLFDDRNIEDFSFFQHKVNSFTIS